MSTTSPKFLRRRPKPVLLLHRLGVGCLGPLQHRHRALRARWRSKAAVAVGVAAIIFVVHSAISHKEYRYISPALPLIMTLAGVGSTMAADWLANKLSQPWVRRALIVALPLGWTVASLALAASPNRIWFWVRSRGSILAIRAVDADKNACGVGDLPRRHVVARVAAMPICARHPALQRRRHRQSDRARRL